MSEQLRSIRVHVEVDTNKQTYELRVEGSSARAIIRSVRSFILDHTVGVS